GVLVLPRDLSQGLQRPGQALCLPAVLTDGRQRRLARRDDAARGRFLLFLVRDGRIHRPVEPAQQRCGALGGPNLGELFDRLLAIEVLTQLGRDELRHPSHLSIARASWSSVALLLGNKVKKSHDRASLWSGGRAHGARWRLIADFGRRSGLLGRAEVDLTPAPRAAPR